MNAPEVIRPRLRGASHQLAFLTCVALGPVLVISAPGAGARALAAIFAVAMAALFGVSASFHRGRWSAAARRRMNRLDRSMIFVATGATYTPVAAYALPTAWRASILGVIWGLSVVGIVITWTTRPVPRWLLALLYVGVAWSGVVCFPRLRDGLGSTGFALVLLGGVCYTLGAVVYALKRPDPWPRWFGFHEIFHVLVVAGAVQHYVVVAFYALPRA
jgi:hemolysin III